MKNKLQKWFDDSVLPRCIKDPEIFNNGSPPEFVDYWESNEDLMFDLNIFRDGGQIYVTAFEMKRYPNGLIYTDTNGQYYKLDQDYYKYKPKENE